MRRNRAVLPKAAALFAGVFALTGCIKMDMDMKLSSNDKVTGSVIVGFSAEAIKAMGQNPADFAKEMVGDAQKEQQGKLPAGASVTVKPYNKGGFAGVETAFKNVPINELQNATGVASDAAASVGGASSGDDDFTIVRKGDSYVFTGVMNLSDMGGETGTTVKGARTTTTMGIPGLDMSKLGKAELRIALTFPGTVTKHNGKLSGKTVTWVPVMGKKTVMNAEGKIR